ncbi:MAG: type II toxin-antitoxin system HicB family antitoxin [Pirellulaceae bacterium]
MKYRIEIEESAEGFAASVPDLPGCHSQGNSVADALDNITTAIQEYLAVADELAGNSGN